MVAAPREAWLARLKRGVGQSISNLLGGLAFIAVLPYRYVYRRNTQFPITSIVTKDDEVEIRLELFRWYKLKTKEAQYVQVAGAVLFTSIISCLSWSNLSSSHWSGPAFWYAGIVLALTSVVLGAQQTMIMPETIDLRDALIIKRRLMARETLSPKPSRIMLFVWQAPLMCMSYSILCFLAGLSSVVLSPLASRPMWNNDARTAFVFLIAAVFASFTFVGTSLAAFILSDTFIRQHLRHKLLISICVGISVAKIQNLISAIDAADRHGVGSAVGVPTKLIEHGCYIVHAMPNTASGVGQSATVFSTGSSKPGSSSTLPLPPELKAIVTWISRCIGTTTFVPAELMNAASVVGASTPAFFATVLDGIIKGGAQRGMSESDALRLAAQAMKGTAELVLRGVTADGTIYLTPSQIKESGMTLNGCTERGAKVMAAHRVEDATADATSQAIDRVFKLGQEAGA